MNIGSQLPVISSKQNPSANVSSSKSIQTTVQPTSQAVSPSSQLEFESVFESSEAHFSRVDGLDRSTQYALTMYSQNQSLLFENSKSTLVGVDVFA
ncbi:hypothetical protein [Marinomonas algicola]|jgi:hypothetical protein|uniref:hypothetical protein n=1 Tax=Marinomonas algicola TaxID=2773454 RepID=UPI00174ECA93|nr:hypothetical protein [Marinomonas algicola]